MKRFLIVLIALFCFGQISHAQITVTVTGNVYTEDYLPIPAMVIQCCYQNGLTINNWTMTDILGHFTIHIPIGYYLKFYYIGCQTIILGPFSQNTDVGDVIMFEEIIPKGSCYNKSINSIAPKEVFYQVNDSIRSY